MNNQDKLWEFIKTRDLKNPKSSSLPFLHEVIKDADYENEFYENFIKDHKSDIIDDLIRSQLDNLTFPHTAENITIVDGNKSSGLRIDTSSILLTNDELKYYIHQLSRRVLNLGYAISLQEIRSRVVEHDIQSTYKYYMKPSQNFSMQSADKKSQLYGNIIIELRLVNDNPREIILLNNKYMDSCYESALPYKEFLTKLFK